jgi:hypothetical protein
MRNSIAVKDESREATVPVVEVKKEEVSPGVKS